VVLWLLSNLPWGVSTPRDSYFGRASAAIAPIFAPAGFGTWEAGGALVTGFIAKEVVVSTLSQLYVGESTALESGAPAPSFGEELGEIVGGFVLATVDAGKTLLSLIPGVNLINAGEQSEDLALSASLGASYTPLAALAFLVFVLVYTPCVATLGAIRSEYGWKWLWVSAGYQFGLAWVLAVVVYQAGRFLGWG
jgi:ferrous iron transport protein B